MLFKWAVVFWIIFVKLISKFVVFVIPNLTQEHLFYALLPYETIIGENGHMVGLV